MLDNYDFGNKTLILNRKVEEHIKATNNPHGVTKYQIGLGNVENIKPEDMPLSNDTKDYIDNNFTADLEVNTLDNKITITLLGKENSIGEKPIIAQKTFEIESQEEFKYVGKADIGHADYMEVSMSDIENTKLAALLRSFDVVSSNDEYINDDATDFVSINNSSDLIDDEITSVTNPISQPSENIYEQVIAK